MSINQDLQLMNEQIEYAISINQLPRFVVETFYGADELTLEDIFNETRMILESDNDYITYEVEYDDSKIYKFLRAIGHGTKMYTKSVIDRTLKDPERTSILLRSLKTKLQQTEDMKAKAKANERGIFSTLVYIIKKCIKWVINKVKDFKDEIMDAKEDRPYGYRQARRDYQDIQKILINRVSTDADWLTQNED